MSFNVRVKKPERLSFGGCCTSDKTLAAVLAKPVEELNWSDYQNLFEMGHSEQHYDSLIFFLPAGLSYLADHPKDGMNCISGLLYFASEAAARLQADGYAEPCRDSLARCFSNWAASFRVIHFDQQAARAKGWRIPYFDMVENSEEIVELLNDLIRFKSHADLALSLIEELGHRRGDRLKSAWFLELARAIREDYATYLDPNYRGDVQDGLRMIPTKATRISALVENRQLLQEHFRSIEADLPSADSSPTYWSDLRVLLDLDG